jgi:hypothetical protein
LTVLVIFPLMAFIISIFLSREVDSTVR